ncbi:MAG: molybdopterin dinucleotide binding domain-containing protein [Promethearchaeia archaeon]
MILNTLRKVDFDQAREYTFGDENSLTEKLAIAIFNPEDMKISNIREKSAVKITSKYGSIVVYAISDKEVPKNMVLMPVSVFSNQITGVENNNLIYKNIEVSVVPTNEKITEFNDIYRKLQNLKEKSR